MAIRCGLSDLGFRKGIIAEAIVSTYNPDGSSNAAPMGIFMIDDQHVAVNFYNSSQTLVNVKVNKGAVLNLTRDIETYYRTAFKDANPDGKVPEDCFIVAEAVKAPMLWSAEATVEVSLEDLATLDFERTRVIFKVHRVVSVPRYPQVYCRAFGVTVEAIINATRVEALSGIKTEQKRIEELLKQIEVCHAVVCRVAPDSTYAAIMEDMMKKVGVRGQL
jgi:hypothetical protein